LPLQGGSLYPATPLIRRGTLSAFSDLNGIKETSTMNPPMSAPAIKIVKSVREQVSPEEWQVRVDLAACYRLVAMYGYTEMIANHISVRVPGTKDQFLLNPYGMLYEEIDASSLIKIDVDGNVLFNATDYGVNKAGFVIHSAVHMARHDAACVAHTHTPAGMAVSAMECGLLPLAQTSMRFVHIAYHDFEGIADDINERARLVQHLGNHEAMILRNHGLLVCGRDVPAAFNVLYRLERACEVQVMAMAANTKLVLPSKEILEETYQKMQPKPEYANRNGSLAWAALRRKLDRVDSSYQN
jgi:ribulose-5-phosphate 4-epimerase/fuculose-1-phosphate aldolase